MTDHETPMTEAGRQSAHILLDAIAAWDGAHPDDFTASDLAVERLLEVGAIKAHDGEGRHVDVDISAVLQGASTTMIMLIAAVAAQNNVTMLDVVASLRGQIDNLRRE